MKKVIFNSCFKEDMQSFIEYRMANFAWNTHRLDNCKQPLSAASRAAFPGQLGPY